MPAVFKRAECLFEGFDGLSVHPGGIDRFRQLLSHLGPSIIEQMRHECANIIDAGVIGQIFEWHTSIRDPSCIQ